MFIYIIKNKVNHKRYIGLTEKKTPQERFHEHIYMRNSKCHRNWIFPRAINKYGKNNFYIEWFGDYSNQIETLDELGNLEKQFIKYYRTYIGFKPSYGYNMTLGGEHATITNQKKVIQYDKVTSKKQQIFDSINEASRRTNTNVVEIIKCCKHQAKSAGGFLWSYENEKPYNFNDENRKIVFQYSIYDLKLLAKYSSAAEASRKTGINSCCICMCCRKEINHSGMFVWRFEGDFPNYSWKNGLAKRVRKINPVTNNIEIFNSIGLAANSISCDHRGITRCCRGESKTYKGFIWQFIS